MTNEQLAKMTALQFAAFVLRQTLDKLQNPNTPRAAKLRTAIREIEQADAENCKEKGEHYSVHFIDKDGHSIQANDLPWYELERIGKAVAKGKVLGQIFHHRKE